MFWFFLICRILFRLLSKGEKRDERSDDEEEEEAPVVEEGKMASTNGHAKEPKIAVNGQAISPSTPERATGGRY